jgi:hypothetical protein
VRMCLPHWGITTCEGGGGGGGGTGEGGSYDVFVACS